MEFDNSFEVPLVPAKAWALLMDIPRITPCMPGAELTEIVDPKNYKGKISVRLGPVALAFAGRVELDSVDDKNFSARVKAQGSDAKGRGAANASAIFRIEPANNGSRVLIHTDLMLSGAVAQYGRGAGMIQATAAQIIGQFAGNLRSQLVNEPRPAAPAAPAPAAPPAAATPVAPLTASPPPAATPPPKAAPMPPPAKPISGLSLIARVVWQKIANLFTGRSDG
jgi:uncharacterized protein